MSEPLTFTAPNPDRWRFTDLDTGQVFKPDEAGGMLIGLPTDEYALLELVSHTIAKFWLDRDDNAGEADEIDHELAVKIMRELRPYLRRPDEG